MKQSMKQKVFFGLSCGILAVGFLQLVPAISGLFFFLGSAGQLLSVLLSLILGLSLCACGGLGIWQGAPFSARIAAAAAALVTQIICLSLTMLTSFGLFLALCSLIYGLLALSLRK